MQFLPYFNWLVAALLSISAATNPCCGFAQEKTNPPDARICHDGPYVWVRDSTTEILRVVPQAETAAIHRNSFSSESADQQAVEVFVGEPTPARFEVSLRRNHEIPQSNWDMPERVLVTSDLEGNFDAFVRILRSQGAVDESLKWSFGSGHLVVLGDSVDRGNYVPQCLWLIYQLEVEAEAAGGAVHMILGNHEAMNLAGDARYLAAKYQWLIEETGLKIEQLYSAESELGRWLRTKNAMEKIGNHLFVHAGVSPQLLEKDWSINQINDKIRENLGQSNLEGDARLAMKSSGPLWYRGLVAKSNDEPKANLEHVKLVLKHFDAKQIVVGHTVVDEISTDFDGRVLRVDLNHPNSREHGVAKALLIENGQSHAVGADGSRKLIQF